MKTSYSDGARKALAHARLNAIERRRETVDVLDVFIGALLVGDSAVAERAHMTPDRLSGLAKEIASSLTENDMHDRPRLQPGLLTAKASDLALTESARKILDQAGDIAHGQGSQEVGLGYILTAILKTDEPHGGGPAWLPAKGADVWRALLTSEHL
jgi:hypothetical protein